MGAFSMPPPTSGRSAISTTGVWTWRLADSSYALYLLHFPMIRLLCRPATELGLAGQLDATVTSFTIAFVCVRLALVFHVHIEQPLLSRLR
jgi:exopolysaccharide production protein ExoZ